MDVKYVEHGELGKTCADCRNFEAGKEDLAGGNCFGQEVRAAGSCNLFEAK